MAHAAMLKEDGGWSAEELSRMKSPGSGALSEQDGRSFMMLLDMCHLLVDRITQEHNFADTNEAGSLRARDTRASAKLTASMYTYWDSAPAGPGVYQMLREWTTENYKSTSGGGKGRGGQPPPQQGAAAGMARVLYLLAENEVQHWPRQRVTGNFFFAKEAMSGAALMVDEKLEKVYCVVGLSTSIGDMMRANGQVDVCGSSLVLTLLPFMGKIVYDGTLRGAPPTHEAGSAWEQQLLEVAMRAEGSGTVLTELPKPASTGALTGKRVLISGLAGRPELNGTRGTALTWSDERGRYAVRLHDGTDVLLKPANLEAAKDQSADGSRGAAAAAAPPREPTELTAEELRVRATLEKMTSVIEGDGGTLIFRRMGYTEKENPNHQVIVLSGAGMPVPVQHGMPIVDCAALQPTAAEVLRGLEGAARAAGAKPESIAVDEKSIVERLQMVLGPTGVYCGYYPPPSKEELAHMGSPHGGAAPF